MPSIRNPDCRGVQVQAPPGPPRDPTAHRRRDHRGNRLRAQRVLPKRRSANRRPEANWRWDRARGGGSVYDLACYNIHHARHVFGCEPTSVYASGQFEGEIDVASSIVLTFPGERTAVISVAHNTWRAHDVEIGGTHGQLRLENPWNNEDQSVTLVQMTAEEHSQPCLNRFTNSASNCDILLIACAPAHLIAFHPMTAFRKCRRLTPCSGHFDLARQLISVVTGRRRDPRSRDWHRPHRFSREQFSTRRAPGHRCLGDTNRAF